MYYNSEDVDRSLTCSCCKEKFADVVKFIAECGSSICDDCSKAIQVDDSGQFKCNVCNNQTHAWPKNGLPILKPLMDLVRLRPIRKALNETAQRLKASIEDTKELINKLESFDRTAEVNMHCDQLELDVAEAAESEINHIKSLQEKHESKIRGYRQQLLVRAQAESGVSETPASSEECSKIDGVLPELSTQLGEFSQKWFTVFNQLNACATDNELLQAQSQADEFWTKTKGIERGLKRKAFDSHYMFFERNYLFSDPKTNIGKLKFFDEKREKENYLSSNFRVDKNFGYRDVQLGWPIIFMPNDKLASGGGQYIIMWNHWNKQELFVLNGSRRVMSLAVLPNGFLASGYEDSSLIIWDLVSREIINSFTDHTDGIVSLAVLKNGNLASLSLDDTIKIWDPAAQHDNLVFTLEGHGTRWWYYSYMQNSCSAKLELLSNGNLVTCSVIVHQVSSITLWDPIKGEKIKSVSTYRVGAITSKVLQNDHVAVSFRDGRIIVFDVIKETEILTIHSAYPVYSLGLLPNDCIVAGGSEQDPQIFIWNHVDGKLVRSIKTDHTSHIISVAVSEDGLLLATGSSTGKFIQLFSSTTVAK